MKIPEVLPENCNILYRADCKEALQNLIDRKSICRFDIPRPAF